MTGFDHPDAPEPIPVDSAATGSAKPDRAVEEIQTGIAPVEAVLELEPEDLDGYSINDLSDYLDRGMIPGDPVIEASPSCQIALAALSRLRVLTATLLDDEGAEEESSDDGWVASILRNITLEARVGRQIPYRSSTVRKRLIITEGAVRGIIRAAADTLPGIIIGRCALDGDVTVVGTPIIVRVEANIVWEHNIPSAAAELKAAIRQAITVNTDLTVVEVTVTITDVYVPPAPRSGVDR